MLSKLQAKVPPTHQGPHLHKQQCHVPVCCKLEPSKQEGEIPLATRTLRIVPLNEKLDNEIMRITAKMEEVMKGIQVSKHRMKYKILCEEITKILTEHTEKTS